MHFYTEFLRVNTVSQKIILPYSSVSIFSRTLFNDLISINGQVYLNLVIAPRLKAAQVPLVYRLCSFRLSNLSDGGGRSMKEAPGVQQ